MQGFSVRNLKYMRAFAEAYPGKPFVQQVAAQIPWFHNVILLEKVKDTQQREWYIRQTIENGWSRAVLEWQIETRLYERQGKAVTNFERTLPAPQSDLAKQLLKDPYNFDFLTLGREAAERDLERGLLDHLRDFLLELGAGFAFLGNQYHLEVGGEDFYIDLLFYHVRLHCCKTKNQVVAEYALRDIAKPLGVSEMQLTEALPENLRSSLPTIEELEAELRDLPESGEMIED